MCENCGCNNEKIYREISEMAKMADFVAKKETMKSSCDCDCDDECVECDCGDCDCGKK